MQISPWQPPQKPGEITETRLILAILDQTFPVNSLLPGERDLAALLGVTRPTLREAMARMERDGWLEIRHGKATRVRDYWKEGNLGVSIALARHQRFLPADYASNLLEVRILLCPSYTSAAIEKDGYSIAMYLQQGERLGEEPEAYAAYDWELHRQLAIHSGNPFFTHFINSVHDLYRLLGIRYFDREKTRQHSSHFYSALLPLAETSQSAAAGELARKVMTESRDLWAVIAGGDNQ